jgi:PAS domain S-box-containing protein
MEANTALCFILFGASLWMLVPEETGKKVRSIAKVFALIGTIIGALTLGEYIFDLDFGIDQLLFQEPAGAVETFYPGRMAPNTALNFVMIGLALLLLDMKTLVSQCLALLAALVGLLGLTGYLFDVRALYGMSFYTPMALNTSIIFFLLSLGIFSSRPSHGLMDTVTSEHSGSFMLRRILPVAIVISFLLGWLHLKCEQLGLYSHEFAAVLFFIMQIVILSIVIWLSATFQNQIDIKRRLVEEELKKYRRNLEELVEERTAELKNIMNTIPDIIYILDMNGDLVKWNRISEKVTGFSPEELIGKHVLDFFPQQDKVTITKVIQEVFEKGYAKTEGHLLKKDGTVIPYEWTGVPLKDERDKVIGLVGIGRDITESKKAAEELWESQERYRALVDNTMFGIAVMDTNYRIIMVNPTFAKLFNKPASDFVGKYCFREFEKREAVCPHCPGARALVSGNIEEVETQGVRDDGSRFYVHNRAVPFFGSDGVLKGFIEMVEDIDARMKAEEALRETRDYLEKLLNYANAPIIVWDTKFIITSFNHAFERLTGYTNKEVIGKNLRILFPEASKEESLKKIERTLSGEYWESVEIPILCKDGSIRLALWNSANIYAKDARTLVATIAQGQDITGRKRAEQEICMLNEELEQRVLQRTAQLEAANKDIEAFSYSVSHDLRAPLRAITGFSSMLIEDYADKVDDEGKRLLNVVKDNTLNMSALIDDLLTLSRIGRKEIERSKIAMDKLAQTTFNEIKATVSEREIQFDIKPLPPAHGDDGLIHQVFFNLLSNAIKFTRYREDAVIEVGAYVEGPENVYYVKDNGAGFDMQYVGKLFGTFQRLHSDKQFEGTGIGLAIVQRVIRRHGGRVWAEGKVNEGATFYFTLPNKLSY